MVEVKQAPVISEWTSVKWMFPLEVLERFFYHVSLACRKKPWKRFQSNRKWKAFSPRWRGSLHKIFIMC